MPRRVVTILAAAWLMVGSACISARASGEVADIDTIQGVYARLKQCWRPPKLPPGHAGMQITVLFAFQRNGALFGKPRITFESPDADQDDSIAYRMAVMETLQHCTPMPFTEGLGGAVAGHPFTLRFDDRRHLPKPAEKRAWL